MSPLDLAVISFLAKMVRVPPAQKESLPAAVVDNESRSIRKQMVRLQTRLAGMGEVLTNPATKNDSGASFAHVGAFIDWYPAPSGGWHAGISVEAWVVQGPGLFGAGPGATLFAGYDWWVRPQMGWGFVASASTAGVARTSSGSDDTGLRYAPVQVLLGWSAFIHRAERPTASATRFEAAPIRAGR